MVPLFAVGDIHGQIDLLEEALAFIHNDPLGDAGIVFVGDYIDRGPNSRAVIETLMEGVAEGERWTLLKGNHDRFLCRFLDDPTYRDPNTRDKLPYLDPRIGGRETLKSYGVDVSSRRRVRDIHADALDAIPQSHVDFLKSLKLMHTTPQHIFVHAGIRPGVPLENQREDDLLWIRGDFLHDYRSHDRLIVHGHTAIELPVHHGNRINIDGGAGHGRPLVPVLLLGSDVFTLGPKGRTRL